jgi:hypothetical protein
MSLLQQTETPPVVSATPPANRERLVSLLVWLIAICVIAFLPLRILGHGWMPIDDALRHAAKVVSGKNWHDVVLLADWVKMDHNPGWHALLGVVHQLSGWQTEGMVMFSIAALFITFCLTPLFWTRRPETWLAILVVMSFASPILITRLTYGRPLLLSAAILMAVLLMWSRPIEGSPWKRLLASTLLFAAGAWVHGSWYLFVLPAVAFTCARQWRTAAWLGVTWMTGSVLGALCTGQPIVFLSQAIEIVQNCFGGKVPTERLAAELQPSGGDLYSSLIVAAVIGIRLWRGASLKEIISNGPFILMVIGFILGLKVTRFWIDWGQPAMLCWMLLQLERPIRELLRDRALPRLAVTALLAGILMWSVASDRDERWSDSLRTDYISSQAPETAGWLPEAGGLVYNVQMNVFYRLFYKNPHANWRYALGFEPTLMPNDLFQGYRRILSGPHDAANYAPWVSRMCPADRLIISRPEPSPIAELEWKRFGDKMWIGRIPRTVTTATAGASSIVTQ